MDVEPAAAAEGSAKPEEEAAPAVKKDTKLSLQFGPPKAGLEKTQPSGFFSFFFYIFAQKREFLGFFQFQEWYF